MSLTTFKSRWVWFSYLYTCLLEWFLCIPPGLPVHASTSYHFLFMLGSGAPCSSCRPPATFAPFHTCQDGPFLSLQEEIFENQPAFVDSSFLQGCIPWHSTKQVPEQAKVCSLEVQDCDSAFLSCSLLSGAWTLPSHDRCCYSCPDQFFLDCKNWMFITFSPYELFNHLWEGVCRRGWCRSEAVSYEEGTSTASIQ